MRGRVEISVRGEDAKVVEIIRRSTVVPDRVLELPEIVEGGDLFQVDLKMRPVCQNVCTHARRAAEIAVTFFCEERTHVVVLLEVLEILVLVLSQGLGDIWILNHVQNRLSFLLQPLVCQEGLLSLLVELCTTISLPVLLGGTDLDLRRRANETHPLVSLFQGRRIQTS